MSSMMSKEDSQEIYLNNQVFSLNTNDQNSNKSDRRPNGSRGFNVKFKIGVLVWTVVTVVMGFFFLICALLQYNDDDPYLWIPAYIIPCIVSWVVSGTLRKKQKEGDVKKGAQVFMPMYLNQNHRLNWIINIHIVYCLCLGLWTLAVHLYRLRYYYGHIFYTSSAEHEEEILYDSIAIGMDSSEEEALELMGLVIVVTWMTLVKLYLLKIGDLNSF